MIFLSQVILFFLFVYSAPRESPVHLKLPKGAVKNKISDTYDTSEMKGGQKHSYTTGLEYTKRQESALSAVTSVWHPRWFAGILQRKNIGKLYWI